MPLPSHIRDALPSLQAPPTLTHPPPLLCRAVPPSPPQLQSAAQLEKSVAAWSLQLRVLVVVACSEKELARCEIKCGRAGGGEGRVLAVVLRSI